LNCSTTFTTTTTTTTIILSSALEAASSFGLDPDYRKFWQSNSLSAKLWAVTVSSNVKLYNVEVLKLSDCYELWSQKMTVIFEAMSLYEIVISGINLYPLVSAKKLITFQLAQRQGLLVIIQVMSNEIFCEIANLKTLHDMWIYLRTSYRWDLTLSYIFVLRSLMHIEQRISPAKVLPSDFKSAFETEWNRIAHLLQYSAAGSATYRKIVKELFACQKAKREFLMA
jgi:hypothetical protein